jgi:hypothetical protein
MEAHMSDTGRRSPAAGWREALLLAVSCLLAAAGALAIAGLLWRYVPAHAAAFACLGVSLPLSTRLVIVASQWTVRLLPLVILIGLPFVGGVVALVATMAARAKWRVLQTLAILALAVAGAEMVACGLVFYSIRAAYHSAGCDSPVDQGGLRCQQCKAEGR